MPENVWTIENGVLIKDGTAYMDYTYADYIGDTSVLSGNVLISGLGLGIVLEDLVQRENVTSVVCVEISQGLIDLVWDQLELNSKATVANKDITEFVNESDMSVFDSVFIDIWEPYKGNSKDEIASIRSLLEKDIDTNKIVIWEEDKFMQGII